MLESVVTTLLEYRIPPAANGDRPVAKQRVMALAQPKYVPEYGPRRGNYMEIDIVEQRLRVDFCGGARGIIGTLAKMQRVSLDPVAQRMGSEAVDRQQDATGIVAHGHGKVA